jgi:hypothetical protein
MMAAGWKMSAPFLKGIAGATSAHEVPEILKSLAS